MAKWLASEVPEWVTGTFFLVGLPTIMVLLQMLVHRRFPQWRRGDHNDVSGIMLSAAVVVYSVAIGLCVITLWGKLDEARLATEAEATNLGALPGGAAVFDRPTEARLRAGVIAYNQDVVNRWPARVRGEASATVGRDLQNLVLTVGELKPVTEAQRAYVDDATARLSRGTELRRARWLADRPGTLPHLRRQGARPARDPARRGGRDGRHQPVPGGRAELPVLRRHGDPAGLLSGRDREPSTGALTAPSNNQKPEYYVRFLA
jgi:hypothetical protein